MALSALTQVTPFSYLHKTSVFPQRIAGAADFVVL